MRLRIIIAALCFASAAQAQETAKPDDPIKAPEATKLAPAPTKPVKAVTPKAAKAKPTKAEQTTASGPTGFECKADKVRAEALHDKSPSPVAVPAIYGKTFQGTCEQAATEAARPKNVDIMLSAGRSTPAEMATFLCQAGGGQRNFSRDEMKVTATSYTWQSTGRSEKDGGAKETVSISHDGHKFTLHSLQGRFQYVLSGPCTPRLPTS